MTTGTNDEMLRIDEMSETDWQYISIHLRQHNIDQSTGLSLEPGTHVRLVSRVGNEVIGGIACRAFYMSLMIDHLWIDDKHRGKGYGTKLMDEAERIGRENGCISSQTSSYSFQAPEFYQKLGYEIFGVFDGYPEGIKKYYLGKAL